MIDFLMMSLGLVPYFTTRTFIPLFSAALMVRWSREANDLFNEQTLRLFNDAPIFLSETPSLILLGCLALAEVVAGKSPEMREITLLVDSKAKGSVAFALCFLLAPAYLGESGGEGEAVVAGTVGLMDSLAYAWAAVIGGLTWFSASIRSTIFGFLLEVDPDDHLGVQGILSWLEDTIGFFGVVLVVYVPILSLGVLAFTLLGLYLTQRFLQHREEQTKVPCTACGASGSLCGLRCPECNTERSEVRTVGLLGVIQESLVTDRQRHAEILRTRKRCPNCGERLIKRRLDQLCRVCFTAPFDTPQDVAAYLDEIRARLPHTLLVLLGLGIVPVLGLIAGVVYYRLSIVSSLRCYLPRGTGMVARWGVRLVNLVILCFQPVPILGMLTLPVMCLANFHVYKSLIQHQAQIQLSRSVGQLSRETS